MRTGQSDPFERKARGANFQPLSCITVNTSLPAHPALMSDLRITERRIPVDTPRMDSEHSRSVPPLLLYSYPSPGFQVGPIELTGPY